MAMRARAVKTCQPQLNEYSLLFHRLSSLPCLANPTSDLGERQEVFFHFLQLLFTHAAQYLYGMSNSCSTKIRPQYLHGVDHRDGSGGASNGDKQGCKEVFNFDVRTVGEGFHRRKDIVALPAAQAFQLPQRKLQRLNQFFAL